MRLLIGDCGDIAPVEAGQGLGFVEEVAVARQALADAAEEGGHVGVVEPPYVTEVAVGDACKTPTGVQLAEKGLDLRRECATSLGQRPGNARATRQFVHDLEFGMNARAKGEMQAVGGDQIEPTLRKISKQPLLGPPDREMHVHAGHTLTDLRHLLGSERAATHGDRASSKVLFGADCPPATTPDDDVLHLAQGLRPAQRQAFVASQAGGCHMDLAGDDGVERARRVRIGHEAHWHAQRVAKCEQQVMLEAAGTAVVADAV